MSLVGRQLARRTPTSLLVLGLALHGVVALLVACWRFPVLGYAVAGVVACWWLVAVHGWLTVVAVLLGVVLTVVLALAYWQMIGPDSFERRLTGPVRSWRRGRYYRARWSDAVAGCGLVRAEYEPVLMSVRSTGGVDELLVHTAPGQLLADWRDIAPRLASALEVRSVRVRRDGPRDVLLLVRWREIRQHDPEVLDDAAVDAEVAETTAQIARELEAEPIKPAAGGSFPRRPR